MCLAATCHQREGGGGRRGPWGGWRQEPPANPRRTALNKGLGFCPAPGPLGKGRGSLLPGATTPPGSGQGCRELQKWGAGRGRVAGHVSGVWDGFQACCPRQSFFTSPAISSFPSSPVSRSSHSILGRILSIRAKHLPSEKDGGLPGTSAVCMRKWRA